MNKLFWVYTIAALLAFNSGFAFAGQGTQVRPALKQGIQELLRKSEKASFEEISEIQSKLDGIRKQLKNQRIDQESLNHIGRIQGRIDTLVSQLYGAMKK